MQCGAKELLNGRTKFDGGCLHCGGGPRTAEDDEGKPVFLMSSECDPASWGLPSSSDE